MLTRRQVAGIVQRGSFSQSAATKSRLSRIQNLFKSVGVFQINFDRSWVGSEELSDPGHVFWVPDDSVQRGISKSFGVVFKQFWKKRGLVEIYKLCTTGKSWP